MPKATAKHITATPTPDPVVGLSKRLLTILDAEDGCNDDFKETVEKQLRVIARASSPIGVKRS
jgi:hypothetical protein